MNNDSISRQAAIDVEGIDEQIRCEMCRNPMHTDRGCDGNCKYDEKLYERIMQILGERIKPLPEPRKGKWILKKELVPLPCDSDPLDWDNYDEDTHSEWKEFYHCSSCDWKSGDFKGGNYCRNCGADMREG